MAIRKGSGNEGGFEGDQEGEDLKRLAGRLRRWRGFHGLTQEKAAKKFKMNRATYANIESARHSTRVENWKKINEALEEFEATLMPQVARETSAPLLVGLRICKECGASVPSGAAYRHCAACGATFEDARCPTCDEPVRESDRFCSKCGTELPRRAGTKGSGRKRR